MNKRDIVRKVESADDGELVSMYEDVWEVIFVSDCFGKEDLVWRNVLEKELHDRGFEISVNGSPEIRKNRGDFLLQCTRCGEETPHDKVSGERGKCAECGRTVIHKELFQEN